MDKTGMDNEALMELGTALGNLNAYLAELSNLNLTDNDVENLQRIKDDIDKAYELSNKLYSEFADYDLEA